MYKIKNINDNDKNYNDKFYNNINYVKMRKFN